MEPAEARTLVQKNPILSILDFPVELLTDKIVDVISSEEFFLRAIETQDDTKENLK
jgi:hypothetical protein